MVLKKQIKSFVNNVSTKIIKKQKIPPPEQDPTWRSYPPGAAAPRATAPWQASGRLPGRPSSRR
jgi:hypothetical protein